jgi:integrase
VSKDRALSPAEIRIVLAQVEHVPTLPTIRLGLQLILLTMVRKSELLDAFGTKSISRTQSGAPPRNV